MGKTPVMYKVWVYVNFYGLFCTLFTFSPFFSLTEISAEFPAPFFTALLILVFEWFLIKSNLEESHRVVTEEIASLSMKHEGKKQHVEKWIKSHKQMLT